MTCLPITEFSCVRNWCQVSFLGIGRSVVHTSRDVAADNDKLVYLQSNATLTVSGSNDTVFIAGKMMKSQGRDFIGRTWAGWE